MMSRVVALILFNICTVCTAQFTVFELDVVSNKLLFNEHDNRIYASIPSANGSNGNSIGRINPETVELEATDFVGSEPSEIALSDDGEQLYIGFISSPVVKQFSLISQMVTQEVLLGTHHTGGQPLFAEDIEVMPGSPHTIAVARKRYGSSPRHGGVVIIENGILLPESVVGHTGSNKIEFKNSEVLIGYTNESSVFELNYLEVSNEGVTAQDSYSWVLTGFGVDILIGNDRLYSTSGRALIIDPTPYLEGIFSGASGPVYYNLLTNQVIYATSSATGVNATLSIFSAQYFLLDEEFTVYGTNSQVRSVTGCGAGCYAFNTSEKIFILKSIETGVSEMVSGSEIVVYPNPTSRSLSIRSELGVQSADLVDMNGKLVLKHSSQDDMDLTGLPGGLYVLKVLDGAGNFSTHRIVKE